MFKTANRDYISIFVDQTSSDVSIGPKRKSLWRWWNQLSRFQRSLVYLCMLIIALSLLYLWVIWQHEGSPLPAEAALNRQPNVYTNAGDNDNSAEFLKVNENKDIIHNIEEKKLPNFQDENPAKFNPPLVEQIVPPSDNDDPGLPKPDAQLEGPAEQPDRKIIPAPPVEPVHFQGPTTARQQAVVAACKHAWRAYRKVAWGHDQLKPISKTFHDWFGLGLSIVDGLDTLYIMNLQKEFLQGREWVENGLRFDGNKEVNLFETTIRVLGGLLSAYHFSGDKLFLNKAIDLGDRLMPSFESDSGVPFSDVNLGTLKAHGPRWNPDSSTSEVSTIQLEFRDLSRLSGDPKYEDAVARVSMHLHNLTKTDGLVPIFINANTGQFRPYSTITLGARGDSYYEYLVKQWIQLGRPQNYLRDDYLEAVAGIRKHLVRRTPTGLLFVGELLGGSKEFNPKMDHLTCYLPGTLALGVHFGMPKEHMEIANDLMYTCYRTYTDQATGLAPEITYFKLEGSNAKDMYVKSRDAHNLLRPEFIESLWYMYQITGNTTYQEWGWTIFQAFEKYTRIPSGGYSSIQDVTNINNTRPKDMMESFFLSETLKYFYLLFSDDRYLLSIDKYVLNSEAHPLPIYVT